MDFKRQIKLMIFIYFLSFVIVNILLWNEGIFMRVFMNISSIVLFTVLNFALYIFLNQDKEKKDT